MRNNMAKVTQFSPGLRARHSHDWRERRCKDRLRKVLDFKQRADG